VAFPSNETVSNGSLNCDHDVGNSSKVTLVYALLKTDTTSHAFLAGGVGAAVLAVVAGRVINVLFEEIDRYGA
jgi:hypothetical protein